MDIQKIMLVALCLSASPVWAASTCQQRVDGNLDKSTRQKVELCLTEPAEPVVSENAARVIYSSVQPSVPQPHEEKPVPYKKTKVYKDPGPVNSEYVERRDFVPFVNDIPSSRDLQEAGDSALDMIAAGQEAAAASSARKNTKPARKLNSAAKPAVKKTVPAAAPAPQPVTPPAELQEAQALQNDPLDSLDDDLEEDVLSDDSFGYNATDPALQP